MTKQTPPKGKIDKKKMVTLVLQPEVKATMNLETWLWFFGMEDLLVSVTSKLIRGKDNEA